MPLMLNIQQIFIIGKAIENYPIWILFSHSNLKTLMELDLVKTYFQHLNLFLDRRMSLYLSCLIMRFETS